MEGGGVATFYEGVSLQTHNTRHEKCRAYCCCCFFFCITVEPLIKDTSERVYTHVYTLYRKSPLKEDNLALLQRTKQLVQVVPLKEYFRTIAIHKGSFFGGKRCICNIGQ